MKTLNKNNSGFTVFEVLLVILTLAIVGAAGYLVATHIDKPKSIPTTKSSSMASSTSTSKNTNDVKTEEDLATVAKSLENFTSSPSENYSTLPNSLSKLKLKLNYNVKDYQYKIIADTGSEKSNNIVYQICTNFEANTFNVSAYNNIFDIDDVDGTQAASYSIHSSGNQCFINDISFMGTGLSLVVNKSEETYKDQLMPDSPYSGTAGYPADNSNTSSTTSTQ